MDATPLPQRAIILCRISDARDEDTAGVDDQERRGRELAKRLDWGVLRVVIENDVSAFKRRTIKLPDGTTALRTIRPGFRETVEALVSGEADGLIAYDLDRAVRDPRDLEDLIDAVEAKKPRPPVESVTGSLKLANDADITMARVMVAVANKASRDTARRVAAARERMALNGEWHGGIRPFGFQADGVTIEPAEAAQIVIATESLLAGNSLASVVRAITAAGVLTSTGRPWGTVEMRDVLMRPRNAGLSVYRGEVVGKASWPAIVSEDSWRAVTALLKDPGRRTTPGNKARWLGSGIYRCGAEGCGRTVICSRSGQTRQPCYRCRPRPGEKRTPGPRHVTRSAEQLDRFIQELIIERLSRADAVNLLKADEREDVAPLHVSALSLRQRLDEQAVLHAQGVIDTRQLVAGSQTIKTQLQAVEDRIAAASMGSVFAGVVGVEDPRAAWEGLDLGKKRGILDSLMEVTIMAAPHGRGPNGAYFDPATIGVTWKR